MDEFKKAIKDPVDKAVKSAGESTRLWFDTFAHLVDGAADKTAPPVTADTLSKDLSLLATAGARDLARMMETWFAIGSAISKLDLKGPDSKGGKP